MTLEEYKMKSVYEDFIIAHADDDTSKLLLGRQKWPNIDIDMAVTAIDCRKKIRTKLPEWYSETGIIYPDRICAEQSSSSFTSRYKAEVASRIIGTERCGTCRIADLTGGLGVDSLAFSHIAETVLYNEMNAGRATAARHNFGLLSSGNIRVESFCVRASGEDSSCFWEMLKEFAPDLIYMDPARRTLTGNKVFLIEDCSPDVLTLLPDLFTCCRNVLIKLSPMADISMLNKRFSEHGAVVREIHVVASGGECKELLLWLTEGENGECRIVVNENGHVLSIDKDMRMEAPLLLPDISYLGKMRYLFEPGKALSKAGMFNVLCNFFGIKLYKAGISTHLYFLPEIVDKTSLDRLKCFGKLFSILEVTELDKHSIRDYGKRYQKAEVTARNIRMTSEELRKRMGASSGGSAHIFGLNIETDCVSDNYIIAGKRLV